MPDKDKNAPYVENYPVLHEWLHKHGTQCMWQAPILGPPKHPTAYAECWIFRGGAMVIVTVFDKGRGWDIWTSCGSNKTAETFADAEARLGIKALTDADPIAMAKEHVIPGRKEPS
jgi:hypothetical protein